MTVFLAISIMSLKKCFYRHAPVKPTKLLERDAKPHVNKILGKEIIKRSLLKNKNQ